MRRSGWRRVECESKLLGRGSAAGSSHFHKMLCRHRDDSQEPHKPNIWSKKPTLVHHSTENDSLESQICRAVTVPTEFSHGHVKQISACAPSNTWSNQLSKITWGFWERGRVKGWMTKLITFLALVLQPGRKTLKKTTVEARKKAQLLWALAALAEDWFGSLHPQVCATVYLTPSSRRRDAFFYPLQVLHVQGTFSNTQALYECIFIMKHYIFTLSISIISKILKTKKKKDSSKPAFIALERLRQKNREFKSWATQTLS